MLNNTVCNTSMYGLNWIYDERIKHRVWRDSKDYHKKKKKKKKKKDLLEAVLYMQEYWIIDSYHWKSSSVTEKVSEF